MSETSDEKTLKHFTGVIVLLILLTMLVSASIFYTANYIGNKTSEEEYKGFLKAGQILDDLDFDKKPTIIPDKVYDIKDNIKIVRLDSKDNYYMEFELFTLKTCEKIKKNRQHKNKMFCGKKKNAYYKIEL